MVPVVTYAELAEHIRLTKQVSEPLVALFTTPTCSYCRMMRPTFEKLLADGVRLVELDATAMTQWERDSFSVLTAPTLLSFKGGEVLGRSTGYKTEDALREALKLS